MDVSALSQTIFDAVIPSRISCTKKRSGYSPLEGLPTTLFETGTKRCGGEANGWTLELGYRNSFVESLFLRPRHALSITATTTVTATIESEPSYRFALLQRSDPDPSSHSR